MRPRVEYSNRPADILSAWTSLEVLSPYTFVKPSDLVDGDERRIARFSEENSLPWDGAGEKARPNTQLFYHVILGAIRMEEATRSLLTAFVDDDVDRRPARGFAGIATITVDRNGVPVPENAVVISSFAWGLPLALRRNLTALGKWPEVSPKLSGLVDKNIRRQDEDGKPRALDLKTIDRAFEALIAELGLDLAMVDGPGFALRHYQWWKATEAPDPPLLGSFFLADLAAAQAVIAQGKHRNLARYLGAERPATHKDLLQDPSALAETVAPGMMPLGRWPGPGRHPLVLLQQAAVNLAASGDEATSLLPVNGPPGTGKTTLLRDLVAALVVARADAMCEFDDPEAAFTYTGEKRRAGAGFTHVYRPHERLCGYEMLVGSSNNKAVENISRELPMANALAADAPNLKYFKTVSDNVAGGSDTWGLIAAVLGNSSNRYAFKDAFWGNEDRGLRTYLSEASGSPQFIEIRDPKSGAVVGQRKPEVVARERPPTSREAALKQWKSAQKAFKKIQSEAATHRGLIDVARRDTGAVVMRRNEFARATEAKENSEAALLSCLRNMQEATDRETAAKKLVGSIRSEIDAHERLRPGAFTRLLGTSSSQAWGIKKAELVATHELASAGYRQEKRNLEEMSQRLAGVRANLNEAVRAAAVATDALKKAEVGEELLRARCGSRAINQAFFKRPHNEVHLAAPWFDEEAHRLRDQVFEAAMQVHRAFIGAAAKPIRNNLDALFKTFFGRSAWSSKMLPLMPSLWSTLFMVVPVVSTTFASIERMIGFLSPGALGWLLIDETGQALPQSAVGAIMRSKRTIVVGDPLQIEPVTSLPTELAETICDEFRIDPDRWNAPTASVQTVADATSVLGANIPRVGGTIRVGVPLLAHRRCSEPMFSISNLIAYANLMVKATPQRPSPIRKVLGPSQWIDIRPQRTEDKWSEAEGEAVVEMIRHLARAHVADLNLYVVTPFVICAQRLRERLATGGLLKHWTDRPWDWVRERVGTVHTVQGREADTVIFVLGAPLPGQRGARGWAGGSVNLLNVATTRAQENLYVVGSKAAWADAGYFQHLAGAFN